MAELKQRTADVWPEGEGLSQVFEEGAEAGPIADCRDAGIVIEAGGRALGCHLGLSADCPIAVVLSTLHGVAVGERAFDSARTCSVRGG